MQSGGMGDGGAGIVPAYEQDVVGAVGFFYDDEAFAGGFRSVLFFGLA